MRNIPLGTRSANLARPIDKRLVNSMRWRVFEESVGLLDHLSCETLDLTVGGDL